MCVERNSHTTHSAVNLYHDGKVEVNEITVDVVVVLEEKSKVTIVLQECEALKQGQIWEERTLLLHL
jgi:uncharacterized protein YwlG (UPF0340 family)